MTGVSNHSNSLPLCSSRPGRPPKRASVGLSLAASHLAAAAGHHPQHSLKKHRMDNGDYYENGHLDVPRMEKSPLLANGYNHPPTHLSHMQFMQLGGHPGAGHTAILSPASLPHHLQAQAQARAEQGLKVNPNMTNMEALARSGTAWENCRAAYEDIVKHLERLREERGDAERALALDHKPRDLSSHNGSSNGHSPVLNLSKTAGSGSVGEHSGSEAGASHRSQEDEEEDDNLSEDLDDDNEKDEDLSDVPENLPLPAPGSESPQALNYSQIASAAVAVSQGGQDPSVSSTETLLRNIQGLLKVAADNARQQERQINYEKAELKMDVLREREVKDSLERQLQDEQKVRGEWTRARFSSRLSRDPLGVRARDASKAAETRRPTPLVGLTLEVERVSWLDFTTDRTLFTAFGKLSTPTSIFGPLRRRDPSGLDSRRAIIYRRRGEKEETKGRSGGARGGAGGERERARAVLLAFASDHPRLPARVSLDSREKRLDSSGPGPGGNTTLRQQRSISQPAQCQYMNMTAGLTERPISPAFPAPSPSSPSSPAQCQPISPNIGNGLSSGAARSAGTSVLPGRRASLAHPPPLLRRSSAAPPRRLLGASGAPPRAFRRKEEERAMLDSRPPGRASRHRSKMIDERPRRGIFTRALGKTFRSFG
ncbi:hypothetical protein KM043_003116 [Ampulex compressa]|nr:hypothetical protein KM043_003116 [Ampulex compressa]